MADEKTEQASPHKLQEARKKGQVAKSADAVAAFMILIVFFTFSFIGRNTLMTIANSLRDNAQNLGKMEITIDNMRVLLSQNITFYLMILGPIFGVVVIGGLVGNLLQTGLLFSTESLTPKAERLNPIEGVKKTFSKKGFLETLKILLRTLLIVVVTHNFFTKNMERILTSNRLYLQSFYATMGSLVLSLFYHLTLLLIVMGVLDYVLQYHLFMKDMMMTKHEVKEEYKMQEGDPLLKQQLRARQRQIIKSRMLGEVKNSRFVVTNPTHYACALKYDEFSDEAPILVAKGRDLIAEQIKKIAEENDIPIHENKPLAQTLYKEVEIGELIPEEMYQAVAEIIAYLEKLDAGMQNPNPPGTQQIQQNDNNGNEQGDWPW